MVRHLVLVQAFGGSNPSVPAMKIVRPFGLAIFIDESVDLNKGKKDTSSVTLKEIKCVNIDFIVTYVNIYNIRSLIEGRLMFIDKKTDLMSEA